MFPCLHINQWQTLSQKKEDMGWHTPVRGLVLEGNYPFSRHMLCLDGASFVAKLWLVARRAQCGRKFDFLWWRLLAGCFVAIKRNINARRERSACSSDVDVQHETIIYESTRWEGVRSQVKILWHSVQWLYRGLKYRSVWAMPGWKCELPPHVFFTFLGKVCHQNL